MASVHSRRAFVRDTAAWLAVAQATRWVSLSAAEAPERHRDDVVRPRPRHRERRHQRLQRDSLRRADRWQEPLHAADEAGCRGPTCATRSPTGRPRRRRSAAPPRGVPPEGEDCLVLNVFTPALGSGRRPVMVWLHGGGFSHRLGLRRDSRRQQPRAYRRRRRGDHQPPAERVRLHVSSARQAVTTSRCSGAAGMLDIVAALEWVRDNIDRFGGDPNLVTIFGQSGGGRKVATLMAMPTAKGLFHRAIIESGAVLRLTEQGRRGADRPSC